MTQRIIVVEPNPLMRMDLVGALQDGQVDAVLSECATLDDATPLIMQTETSVTLFVSGVLVAKIDRATQEAIRQSKGKIVCVGDPSPTVIPITVLEKPFTTEMIMDALVSDASDPPECQPEVHT